MTEYRQGEKQLTNDTMYRAGDGVRGNMSSGGSAAVHDFTAAGSRRRSSGPSRFAAGYAERVYGGGVSAGAADRAGRSRTAEDAAGELRRRRNVSRAPDMSKPRARRAAPAVSLGDLKKPATAVKTKVAEPRIHTIPQVERKPFPIAFIFTTLMCSLLFMYMIYNIVRINEYTIDISEMKSRISELTAHQNELTLKLERKNDLVEIERIATQEYGMVKRDKVAKQYVNVVDGDVIEAEPDEEPDAATDGLSALMSAISSNFGDILG